MISAVCVADRHSVEERKNDGYGSEDDPPVVGILGALSGDQKDQRDDLDLSMRIHDDCQPLGVGAWPDVFHGMLAGEHDGGFECELEFRPHCVC